MFGDLVEKDKLKKEDERVGEPRRSHNADLEDGEIASDRDDRRLRDPYRDDRRQERRDDRRDEPKRRNYYENGDRLNFHRHRRDGDRAGPIRHSWQSRSPPTRHDGY